MLDVGARKQLFIDELFVESSHGVRLTMNPPAQTGQALITGDQPWEVGGPEAGLCHYSSVLKESGCIRVWYDTSQSSEYDADYRRVAYAESDDGLRFTKPALGLNEIDGSKANNIVMPGKLGGCSVWIDPNAPAEHRYKSQTKVYPSGGFHMFSSPDGYRWQLFTKLDIGPGGWDTQSIVFWDPADERYVMYTRAWIEPPEDPAGRFRTVRRLESDDLVHWENQTTVLQADQTDLAAYQGVAPTPPIDYYGAAVFPYDGADRAVIMLAQSYWHFERLWIKPGPGQSQREEHPEVEITDSGEIGPATFDVRLLVSRDNKTFQHFGDRAPFMRLGPAGRFDSKMIWAMPNPVRMGDEIWIYYVGMNQDHNSSIDQSAPEGRRLAAISRAVMRLDGFVSADASSNGGELVTPPITFEGGFLELNLDTSAGGSALVELLETNGEPVEGFGAPQADRLNGNALRMPVSWGGSRDVSRLAGRPVKIRFVMRDCKLYAFQFRN